MIQIIYSHDVFDETAVGICDALFLVGFDSVVCRSPVDFQDDVLFVVLGLHRMNSVPKHYIAIQAEQVSSKWMTESYLQKLRNSLCVWDFSPRNCRFFQERGIACYNIPTRVPLGIFWEDRRSLKTQDIDVLFYGAKCPRRESLVDDFSKNSKLKVVFRYNDLFHDEREDLISRSRVVLNIHYWPSASLETHRVEYLCSRGKCVISEPSLDSDLDLKYSPCVVFAPLHRIVETATHYATDEVSRRKLEASSQRASFLTQTSEKTLEQVRRNVLRALGQVSDRRHNFKTSEQIVFGDCT